jgi:hypothetical protein
VFIGVNGILASIVATVVITVITTVFTWILASLYYVQLLLAKSELAELSPLRFGV